MRASTSASQACGSTSLSLAVMIRVAMAAARSAPRSEPANSHERRPRAKPLRARSAAMSGQALQDDPGLLVLRPATPTARLDDLKPPKGTARTAVHTHCSQRNEHRAARRPSPEAYAASVGKCERTVDRWGQRPDDPLPIARAGTLKLVHIPGAKAWMTRRVRTHKPRRRERSTASVT